MGDGKAMTRAHKREVIYAGAILTIIGVLFSWQFKIRKPIREEMALEKLEVEFFTTMGEVDELHETAKKVTKETFSYEQG